MNFWVQKKLNVLLKWNDNCKGHVCRLFWNGWFKNEKILHNRYELSKQQPIQCIMRTHMENPHGASWFVGAVTFFKVSILVTFSRSQFFWLFQGLNSYDFLQKCQTPLAVIFVLSTPTKGWSNTGCPMDVDHASLLYILFEDQRIVFAKSFLTVIFPQLSIVFQCYLSWLINKSNIAHISPHCHHRRWCTFFKPIYLLA